MSSSSPRSSLEEMGCGKFCASRTKIKASTGERASKRLKSNRLTFPPGKGTQPTCCSLRLSLNKQNIALRRLRLPRTSSTAPQPLQLPSVPAHAWLCAPRAVALVAAFPAAQGGRINSGSIWGRHFIRRVFLERLVARGGGTASWAPEVSHRCFGDRAGGASDRGVLKAGVWWEGSV